MSFVETFIMVATSPTVINSVTFIDFLSILIFSKSSSLLFLWTSLFSFLYFDALDLEEDWSFSRVSLICFWTTSSVGDAMSFDCLLNLSFFSELWLLFKATSFAILLLFLFDFTDLSVFSSLSRSIFSPVFFKPDNFSNFVCILWESRFSVFLSVSGLAFSTLSISFEMVFCFFKSRFISPIFLNLGMDELEVMTWFFSFSICSFSNLILNSSFSFFFSSLKSCDSTLLDLSELNSWESSEYCSSEIFEVGLASISCPLDNKNSTTRSNEILNSLTTLFNLTLFSATFQFLIIIEFFA